MRLSKVVQLLIVVCVLWLPALSDLFDNEGYNIDIDNHQVVLAVDGNTAWVYNYDAGAGGCDEKYSFDLTNQNSDHIFSCIRTYIESKHINPENDHLKLYLHVISGTVRKAAIRFTN